ncbi:hypothetical protein [Pelagerythrobacter sp.]|uniref:hypothetical protein n=1 Tax=Pelagerythrobacter sp. TaxID=2800702 RepID=UPI0035AFD7E8
MTCNCIEEMDAQLADHNTKLGVTFGFGRDGSNYTLPSIVTEKVEKRVRKGPALAIPTFCPFCGQSYRGAAGAPSTGWQTQIEAAPIGEDVEVFGRCEDWKEEDDDKRRVFTARRTKSQPNLWWMADHSLRHVEDVTHWRLPTGPISPMNDGEQS